MHIYFSGIGGAGIGPLALIAKQAGYDVSGSDQKENLTVEYLKKHGVSGIHIGQAYDQIADVHADKPIDWFVYTSALPMDQPDAPELKFCADNNIKATKRDEFLAHLLKEKNLKMIAVAGTHGKTTTTAMLVWLFKQLGVPVSYSVGGKISFGDMGEYNPESEYFVYEADEYDRNFLAFHPHLALITGIDWDHPDIYPTREGYYDAFKQFLIQSSQTLLWQQDIERLDLKPEGATILDEDDPEINTKLLLPGLVNRQNAWEAANALKLLTDQPMDKLLEAANRFPGISRRFEQIAPGIYSDYAHTPPKVRGALQSAREVAGDNVVVVYEGLHNTRQHFIKRELKNLFEDVKRLYVVPSYLAREDPNLPTLTPGALIALMDDNIRGRAKAAALDDNLAEAIKHHVAAGDTVLCLTAGGGGSLDEWLRQQFDQDKAAKK
jgi:UDP-N-acetylmuramate--alanine ligase